MSYLKQIQDQFPVRKTRQQKKNFQGWVMKQMRQMGYQPSVETDGRAKSENIIAGEPSRCKVLFVAGYDTPARSLMPLLVFPRNLPLHLAYSILNVLLLLILPVAVLILVQGIWHNPRLSYGMLILTYLGLLALKMLGPANLHNANTGSGAAALLELMARVPEEIRDKAAFILFDNSMVGRMGSKAWAREHVQTQYTRLTVCLNQLGVGDELLLISKDLARKSDHYAELEQTLADRPGKTVRFFKAFGGAATSDHASFRCSVLLMAAKRSSGVGYLVPAIGTKGDTQADESNIGFAADALADWLTNTFGNTTNEQKGTN